MPSEAFYAAVQQDSDQALKSYDTLVVAVGEKKAQNAVKTLLQQGTPLPKDFVEKSHYLPDFVVRDRGLHQRALVCDREERGVVHLKPEQALDISLLLSKMKIEEDTSTAGKWSGVPIEGPVAEKRSSEVQCGIGTLTTVVERMRGSNAFFQEFKNKSSDNHKYSNAASSSSSRLGPGAENLAGEVALRYDDSAVPDISIETLRVECHRLRENKNKRVTKQLAATLETAADPQARREAVEKLDEMNDTRKRDEAKASMIDRYTEVASLWEMPLGTFDSLYEFLACSLDNFKTTSSCVREVMKSPVSKLSTAEAEELEKVMKRLKNRGHTSRETNSAPVTLMDIIAANEAGLLSMSELVPLLLCFYCGLRPKEVCKIACDYKSNIDSAITVSWDKKDLILNFSKTTVKSNLYKCVRARCVCAELIQEGISNMYCICSCKNKMRLFTCETDVYKISVRVFSHIEDIGGHSYRIGCTIWLWRCGIDPLKILVHCRWQEMRTLLGYLRSLPECSPDRFRQIAFCAA